MRELITANNLHLAHETVAPAGDRVPFDMRVQLYTPPELRFLWNDHPEYLVLFQALNDAGSAHQDGEGARQRSLAVTSWGRGLR